MKRILALVLALVMALGMAACSPAVEKNPATEEGAATVTPEAVPEAAPAGKKVALIVNGTFGDEGNYDAMRAGITKAAEEFGLEASFYEQPEAGLIEESIRSFAQEGYNLIIGCFASMAPALDKVAGEFPDVEFACNYAAGYVFENDNVTPYDYACYEAMYVIGTMAGLVTKTNKIGDILGGEDGINLANANAFLAGARSVNPDAEALVRNGNTFTDAAKVKEIASSLFSEGADVIYSDCGGGTFGAIEAAVEAGKYCSGDAMDHSSYAPGNHLIDTMISFNGGAYNICAMFVNGELDGQPHFANYANGGIGTTKNKGFAENCADPELAANMEEYWAIIEDLEAKITSGEVVPPNDSTNNWF